MALASVFLERLMIDPLLLNSGGLARSAAGPDSSEAFIGRLASGQHGGKNQLIGELAPGQQNQR